ncbi:MAG: NAD(P)/FAD-dependent oxidoreductase [Alphaproteobacteria bacterium]|nr:MAG: NAD(P)/FAD-dependent oxidoreductase [Alphaproteobacteria bacterium]
MKTIIILGGGVGGIITANELSNRLNGEHKIILIEKYKEHTFAPSYLWLMNGDRRKKQINVPLKSLMKKNIEVVNALANEIVPAEQKVKAGEKEYHYDFLVIALGADLAPEKIQGWDESIHTFYTCEGAVKLNETLKDFAGGKVAIVIASMPYKCPGAPHEGAMLIEDFFASKGIRKKVGIDLFTPEPQPLPVAGPELGSAVKAILDKKGIRFHPLMQLSSVDTKSKQLLFNGKVPFEYDLLIVIPPHQSPAVIRNSDLANANGWIDVNTASLQTKYENVFAIGDITSIPLPGRWVPDKPMMLPKAGVFAHIQADVVAKNIVKKISGENAREKFCADGYCMLEAGEDLAGFAYGDFFGVPHPQIHLKKIGKKWHIGKVLFEKWWLSPIGIKKLFYKNLLQFQY